MRSTSWSATICRSTAQICLFALQFAGMAGTLLGGPLADRFGRKTMIWISVAGTAPFSLLLPHVGPAAALLLCCAIGMILISGYSVIIVYAQELLPRHVGTVSGLFFGLSFGMAGLGSVLLGPIDGLQGARFRRRSLRLPAADRRLRLPAAARIQADARIGRGVNGGRND